MIFVSDPLCVKHNAASGLIVQVMQYVRRRLPFGGLLLPLLAGYALAIALASRAITSLQGVQWVDLASGFLSFALLVLLLRIIDDLDDIDDDCADADDREWRKIRYIVALIVISGALLVLNVRSALLLSVIAAVAVFAAAGPLLVKAFLRPTPPNLLFAFFVFEAAPAGLFCYAGLSAALALSATFDVQALAATSLVFWLGYEVWKFSRKFGADVLQPYFLSRRGCALALVTLLAGSAVVNVVFCALYDLSRVLICVMAILPTALILAIWITRERSTYLTSRPWWSGMVYLGAVEVALTAELLLPYIQTSGIR